MRSALFGLFLVFGLLPSVTAQTADLYRGTVVNSGFRDRPATLELSVVSRTDTLTTAWLKIGSPLGGSGFTVLVPRDLDSLYLVTVSQAQDTIVWASGTRAGTIGGTYYIKGGQFAGQAGTWRLEPQARISATALTLIALFFAVSIVLLLYVGATFACDGWWRRRDPARIVGLTPEVYSKLDSLGGWIALTLVGNSLVALYLLATVGSVFTSLDSTWMMGTAVPGLRTPLLVEAITHFLQIVGFGVGLVLIVRRSPLAPPFWVGFLTSLAVAAFVDIATASEIVPRLTTILGSQGASESVQAMDGAEKENTQLIFRAMIWALYWLRSKRVRIVFSPFKHRDVAVSALASFGTATADMSSRTPSGV
jgi:hypothetical protein